MGKVCLKPGWFSFLDILSHHMHAHARTHARTHAHTHSRVYLKAAAGGLHILPCVSILSSRLVLRSILSCAIVFDQFLFCVCCVLRVTAPLISLSLIARMPSSQKASVCIEYWYMNISVSLSFSFFLHGQHKYSPLITSLCLLKYVTLQRTVSGCTAVCFNFFLSC